MNVRIQFTVDMKDIPSEVSNRLTNIYYKSEELSGKLKEILKNVNEDNIVSATKEIDTVRKQLIFMDSVLEDSYNILTSYATLEVKELENKIETPVKTANE